MRLIDANALKERLEQMNPVDYGSIYSYEAHNAAGDVLGDVARILDSAPTIEPDVKRGEWIHGCSNGAGTEFCYCSECDESALIDKHGYTELSDFCPNCGADMRKESK